MRLNLPRKTTRSASVAGTLATGFCWMVGMILALLSPGFAEHIMQAFSGGATLVILGSLAGTAVVGGVYLACAGGADESDFLIVFGLGVIGCIAACLIFYAVVATAFPGNGWSYLSASSRLQSIQHQVWQGGGSMDHPDNAFIVDALGTQNPIVRVAASDKLDEMEILDPSEFSGLVLAMEISGLADSARGKLLAGRGWASGEDKAAIRRWARKHPPGDGASLLRQAAWLRLAGEVEMATPLDLPDALPSGGDGS